MKFSIDDVIALIPDKGNGLITAKGISNITGYYESEIRKIINQARSNGFPICSTRCGYYISHDHEDIEETIRFLTRRLNTQMQAINGLKNINKES